ncbi:hypothetical protein ACS0TY_003476 [Phlomoides rotata]
MNSEVRGKGPLFFDETVVTLEEEEDCTPQSSSLCLIGKVLTSKPFNSFGFLEAMKKAMRPPKGFTVMGPNLFSFQFCSMADLSEVLDREPWLFDRNLVLLRELGMGEQPSSVTPYLANFWLRMYDLPTTARNPKHIKTIAGPFGEVLDIDSSSLNGVNWSVRVKIRLDTRKPLKQGMHLNQKNGRPMWIPIKYECLPSFCFICGSFGHMWREHDLADEEREIQNLPENKLLFGD